MRMFRTSRKALSPIIGSIILIAVTVAVALASAAWLGSLGFSFMATEELHINSCKWAPDVSYADLTIKNSGSNTVTVQSARIGESDASSISFVSGNSAIKAGEEATLRVYFGYSPSAKYQFSVITSTGISFFYISTSPNLSSVSFKMEWGLTTTNDTFKEIALRNRYSNPVIVCTPKYTSGVPRSIRITDVASQSFKVRVQNPSSTSCPDTEISYLVVEEGNWTSPLKLEAFKYSTNTVGRKNNWNYDIRNYQQPHSGNIIVFHQVMSYNDPAWITTYVSRKTSTSNPPNSGDDGFRIALNGAEAASSHANETIGYIIFEEGFGEVSGIKYNLKRTGDSISGYSNSPPFNTAFSQSFNNVPSVVLAGNLEMDGGDGGWSVVHTLTMTQAGLMIDEDQVSDSERSHTSETCGFFAFETEGAYP